ncbi:regulatory protein (GGDEF and EAL domains) [Legionella busanensis]|uniref:Regulatory protein (GGDEF and EAL domains) n=1 Tax=Legionella busanensis TaxID=190655 RepID=A0A378JQJ4_9GAMM|nr:EAL domain-containing protein [Legionella busanensis]STX52449.1 regulatory protein (GGDEF and EAL domains) [Legionella busanensis]
MFKIQNNKILLVDDNQSIHEDFYKILKVKNEKADAFQETFNNLFNPTDIPETQETQTQAITLHSAFQGQEALQLVKKAMEIDEPYALAFVDIRMPPGWDGVLTIKKIWEVDPNIQMVICSAHSDYSLEEISKILDGQDNLLILKKPFDVIEVRQLTSALLKKWALKSEVALQIKNLEQAVAERTTELQNVNSNLDKNLTLTRATIESTQEGILALDQNENILIYNQNFLDLWNIPVEVMNEASSLEVLKKLASQVENSSDCLTMILNLCKQPKTESVKELKLYTGQVFELYSHYFSHGLEGDTPGVVLSFRDITENKQLQDELLHLATHDALTGLPNRIILMDRLEQAISYAKRSNLLVGIFILDLDNFKQVNDTLGHKAGDELLNLVAIRMKNCFRESDTITRFGGDEFVIILTGQINFDNFTVIAESLQGIFNTPFSVQGNQVKVTGSIGISVYPLDGEIPDDLLKNADTALYHAKDTGRDNFKFYTSELNYNLIKRVELESALQKAIENEEFVLFYQPLFSVASNKIIGVEALLRWNHPTLGMLAPNSFLATAEKTGLIIPIGNWVLNTACAQTKKWQETIFSDLSVAVNISGSQILRSDFIHIVKRALQASGLEPRYLELEITEHVILENSIDVFNTMKILRDMGIKIAMDDFGVGYSNLNYVKFFPFDKIKIDKSFIQDITTNIYDKNIIEAIINMTKSMGLQILAEGVETKEQLEFLRAHHSNQIQGYYISHPLQPSAVSDFLKNFKFN